tara:strand:+ start:502 stop:2151 length:1650 start_codon:yes stop_codon:yes gene_type:complete
MEFLERLFKNKTFRYLFIGLFVFFGIILFQQYALFFLTFLVIAIMVESGSKDAQNSKKEKYSKKKIEFDDPQLQKIIDDLESNDISRIKGVTERMGSVLEDIQTPKTFLGIVGGVGINADLCYSQGLLNNKNTKDHKNAFLLRNLERDKKACDDFFDGKEYVKCWSIYRYFEQQGTNEEEFNKTFPDYISIIKQIRERDWEDIAWAWFINDKSEEIYGNDTCTKEIFNQIEDDYSIKFKENYLANLSEEEKKNYRLLIKLNPEDLEKKKQELAQNVYQNLPEDIHPNGKPNKINSVEFFNWSLDDAIKFGTIIRNSLSGIEVFDGYGMNLNPLRRKKLKFASSLRNKDQFEKLIGKNISDTIQDFDRVMDFYEFEMFDEDPIQTAIDNEDIERIIFYSLIHIPRRTILNINELENKNIEERNILFAVMKTHTLIILQVLEELAIFNTEEITIKTWIENQFTDPNDKGVALQMILEQGVKDKRFIKDIWFPLVKLIELQFIHPKGLYGNVKEMLAVIDNFTFDVLDSYFSGDSESAYKQIKPFIEALKED